MHAVAKLANSAKFCQSSRFERLSEREGSQENGDFGENGEFGEIFIIEYMINWYVIAELRRPSGNEAPYL